MEKYLQEEKLHYSLFFLLGIDLIKAKLLNI